MRPWIGGTVCVRAMPIRKNEKCGRRRNHQVTTEYITFETKIVAEVDVRLGSGCQPQALGLVFVGFIQWHLFQPFIALNMIDDVKWIWCFDAHVSRHSIVIFVDFGSRVRSYSFFAERNECIRCESGRELRCFWTCLEPLGVSLGLLNALETRQNDHECSANVLLLKFLLVSWSLGSLRRQNSKRE